jgi:hypothetical protein
VTALVRCRRRSACRLCELTGPPPRPSWEVGGWGAHPRSGADGHTPPPEPAAHCGVSASASLPQGEVAVRVDVLGLRPPELTAVGQCPLSHKRETYGAPQPRNWPGRTESLRVPDARCEQLPAELGRADASKGKCLIWLPDESETNPTTVFLNTFFSYRMYFDLPPATEPAPA